MAFYHRQGETFVPSGLTRGPWHHEHQHGGPPTALLTGLLEAAAPSGFHVARLTAEFLRPVPLQPLTAALTPFVGGRSVQRAEATLHHDGRTVLRIRALFIRHRALPLVGPPPAWPEPATAAPFVFPFFPWDEGYHRAIECRIVAGTWPETPLCLWARPRCEVLEGEGATGAQRVVVLADAQSGFGPPADLEQFTFVNPDLTVVLGRPPVGDWVGFEVDAFSGDAGAGLAESRLWDDRGQVGRSIQTVVVSPR